MLDIFLNASYEIGDAVEVTVLSTKLPDRRQVYIDASGVCVFGHIGDISGIKFCADGEPEAVELLAWRVHPREKVFHSRADNNQINPTDRF